MLSDDGLILDDGVALRLSEHRWIISTSTGHADAINSHMEELLQDPVSRLERVCHHRHQPVEQRHHLWPEGARGDGRIGHGYRHLTARRCPSWGSQMAPSAEASRPAWSASASPESCRSRSTSPRAIWPRLWDRILAAGAPFGIEPIGSEANHVLRVEKGFLSTGSRG